jgi:hypothetical protein
VTQIDFFANVLDQGKHSVSSRARESVRKGEKEEVQGGRKERRGKVDVRATGDEGVVLGEERAVVLAHDLRKRR